MNSAYSSLRKRVAKALVNMVSKFNVKEEQTAIEILRENLTPYASTATKSLIGTLSVFKSEGLVAITTGKINVNNLERRSHVLY